jgi:hypothetical protein
MSLSVNEKAILIIKRHGEQIMQLRSESEAVETYFDREINDGNVEKVKKINQERKQFILERNTKEMEINKNMAVDISYLALVDGDEVEGRVGIWKRACITVQDDNRENSCKENGYVFVVLDEACASESENLTFMNEFELETIFEND